MITEFNPTHIPIMILVTMNEVCFVSETLMMQANIANMSVITKAFLLDNYFKTKTLSTAPKAPPIVKAANVKKMINLNTL